MSFKLIFLGDIVGRTGRKIVKKQLSNLRDEFSADMVFANGENASGGLGIDPSTADEIFSAGVDFITTGNHIWDKKTIIPYLKDNSHRIIRPDNYPPGAPGKGSAVVQTSEGFSIGVMNLMGRVFIGGSLDCPFRNADEILDNELKDADFTFLDFHAEVTSEKVAMAFHLDGRVNMMVGTHTHVQTADARILPQGLAYITDAGMCGPLNSVIGVESKMIVERFITGRPTRFETAKGESQINGVCFELDKTTKSVISVEIIHRYYEA